MEEKVAIGKVCARSALSVVLSPVDTSRNFSREDNLKLLHSSILGVALVAGDVLRTTPYRSRGQLFTVAGVAPA